jgi:HSP20 family protein
MALVSFSSLDPFAGLLELQETLDRLLQNPSIGLNLGTSGASSVFPAVNIFSDEDGFVVRAEVPGIPAGQINVTVEPRRLTISGEKPPAKPEKGSYHRRERRWGRFGRSIHLPEDLDAGKASAECRNGLLTVRIPKLAAAKPRQISVQPA